MSAYLEITFERRGDLQSLRGFLSQNVPDGIHVQPKAPDTVPDNAMPGPELTQLAVTLTSTGAVSGTVLVLREWLKTRVTRVRVSVGANGERTVEVTGANAEGVLALENMLTKMLDGEQAHDHD